MTAVGHRIQPHPADLMLQAWASTPEACIAEAVRALVESFADTTPASGRTRHDFRLVDASWEERLISTLEEVLFLLDARGEVPAAVTVTPTAVDVVAVTFQLAALSDVSLLGSAPKGIARSGLEFRRINDHWQCEVIVDV
jgi:SHS2 domain-containing protein